MTRIDPYLNVEFEPSRRNQLFKNRASQIAYNNLKARQKRQGKAHIDNILNHNRNALLELLGDSSEITVSKGQLSEKGFNMIYHTHRRINNKTEIWSVYEIDMYDLGNDQIKLINSQKNK